MRLTISIPDGLGRRFLAAIPRRHRSATIARLLAEELARHERRLADACHAANADAALDAEVGEWQAFDDPVSEVDRP